jgi:3-carboxy-cis,cis-muconate cycloisomerase
MSVRLLESLVTTEPLAEVFSDRSVLAAMLQFETALARVEAQAGIIPTSAAETIARAADASRFDPAAIARDARQSATIAVPLVDALRGRVAESDETAATFVHWGATSQDVIDTALVLCLARAAAIIRPAHARLLESLRHLSDTHARTIMLGRTLLQPAPPITFGLKAAGWFAAVSRAGARLMATFDDARVLQFGGAAGTLAVLTDEGPRIAADLARELGLNDPSAPWHAQRDRFASLVTACGVYAGTLGKIARDVSLLMQADVSEAAEPGGGSSTLPHKRNPAACAAALAAANHVPALVAAFLSGLAQEHERAVGGWQAEAWTIAATVQATGSALSAMADAVSGLTIDPQRMRANLVATRGVIFAERAMMLLSPVLGRDHARRIIDRAVRATRDGQHTFAEALAKDTDAARVIAPGTLATFDAPEEYLGAADVFRRRLLGGDQR